jgi:prolyl-tRNA synthetase
MRQSQLFTKTRKHAPSDEVSQNAQLLLRAGFVHKEMAGVYSYLPLGRLVLENINRIIRQEMTAIGGQEVSLSALQDKALWEKTGRWDSEDVDVWFKTKLQNDTELGLGFTHEEPITRLMREHIASYRDLPQYVFQIQTKFRNEVRAKSGIMRTREFPMKDLYSFHRDQADLDSFYETASEAYERIFERVGIGRSTYKTFASGGSFSKYSHEFQTACEAGEDTIYVNKERHIAVNEEVYNDEVLADLGLKKDSLEEMKAIEVGNIFKLGDRFSSAIGLTYKDEQGEEQPVIMGCFGIGPSRLLGTVAEKTADERGLVWPREVAPFTVHLVRLGDDEQVVASAEALYGTLKRADVSVLYDDRPLRPGEKFADSDLIGIPVRVVVSPKTVESGMLEVVERATGEVRMMDQDALMADLNSA